jgi:hypothetical protein
MAQPPSVERLKELFEYSPETGLLTRRVTLSPNAKRGDRPGYRDKNGYWLMRVDGHMYAAHRLIWLYVYGSSPSAFIDHRDGNPDNNRIDNLRLATPKQNAINSARRSNNKSGYRGVTWSKRLKKWRAGIKIDGKSYEIGRYELKEDAIAAYREVATRQFGEFYSDRETTFLGSQQERCSADR